MATANLWVVSMQTGQALPVACRPSSSFGFLLHRSPQILCLVASPFARCISISSPPPSRATPLNALAIHAQDPDFYQIPYVDGRPVGKRLKLWNLPPNCKHSELLEWFAGVDVKVESLEFTDDPVLNAQGVGGFVEFVTKQDACIAIVRLDGYKFRGHYIRMDFAEKRPHSRDYGSRRPFQSTGSSRSRGSFSTSPRQPVTDMVPSHSGTMSGNAQPTPSYEATNSGGVSSGYGGSIQSSVSPSDGASNSSAVQQISSDVSSHPSHVSSDQGPKYNGTEPNGQSFTVPSANSVSPSIPGSSSDYGNANSQSGPRYDNTGEQSSITSTQSSSGMSQGPSGSSHIKSSSGFSSSQQRPSYGKARQSNSSSSKGSSSNNNRKKQSYTGSFTMDDVASFATPSARTNFPMSRIVEEYDEIFKNYGAQDEAVVEPWSKNVNFRSGPMFASPQPSSLNRLFVGNLAVSIDDASLQELFSKFGTVLEARVLRDQESGRSRGFAVVAMSSADEMKAASKALDGWLVESRPLKVEAVASSH